MINSDEYQPVTIMPWDPLPAGVKSHLYFTTGKTNIQALDRDAREEALGDIKSHGRPPTSVLLHMHAKETECSGEHVYYPAVTQALEPVTPSTRAEEEEKETK